MSLIRIEFPGNASSDLFLEKVYVDLCDVKV